MRRAAGYAKPTPTPITNRGQQQDDHCGAVGHSQETGDVEHHSEDDHQPGVAAIGERGDRHLGDERRQEAHGHDQPERTFTDPVLVAELVEHGEHHAVSRGEQPRQRAENDNDRPSTHSASITDGPDQSTDVLTNVRQFLIIRDMSDNRHGYDLGYELDDKIVADSPARLKALGNPLRTLILDLVLERAMTVTELAERVRKPRGTVAHHVDVLVDAGCCR